MLLYSYVIDSIGNCQSIKRIGLAIVLYRNTVILRHFHANKI